MAKPRWMRALNLAAELAYSGVTINAFRPGAADTSMQAWIRGQDLARMGTALHERLSRSYEAGVPITMEPSVCSLLARLDSDATGQAQDVSGPP
jgi:NAD(P)-dependent dehydrogenase (short-subunit alcohol dehydrogenase family)